VTGDRLCDARLASLPARVSRPAYDRAAQRTGIVHFGIGAFHRAHQAVYTDDAMAGGDRDWAIAGVSLRSPDVRDQLQPQDGLYTLSQRDASGERLRVIGAVREVHVARENPEAVVNALASADVHIVTFTITEKGYWRDPSSGSLLIDAPDVAHDLRGEGAPRTIYGFLERSLSRRRAARLAGMSLVSCDNLAENGPQLAALLDEFLERRDAALATWARRETSCPSTMVDRIVPATTAADLTRIAGALQIEDRAAVVTEPFHQWVIEDRFVGPRPRWEVSGAQLVAEVRPFETAKLRMLNGSHSALAYIGLGLGHDYVHQAVTDPDLGQFIVQLMRDEAATTLTPAPTQDLSAYADALFGRFNNPALPHRLAQIAMDGTQKIPQRWLASIAALEQSGKTPRALLFAVASWIAFVCTPSQQLDDPLAEQLLGVRKLADDPRAAVQAVVGEQGLFRDVWRASPSAAQTIESWVSAIKRHGMRRTLLAFHAD
jgi:fructuronate reductase